VNTGKECQTCLIGANSLRGVHVSACLLVPCNLASWPLSERFASQSRAKRLASRVGAVAPVNDEPANY
jgi:hypothetical protein